MFPVDSNVLIGILIFVAILVYVAILRRLEPEKILGNITSKRNPKKQKSRAEDPENKEVSIKDGQLDEAEEKTEKPKKKKPAKKVIKKKGKSQETDGETKKKEKGRFREHKSSSPACSFEFGYLGTLPKNASIPDECLGCPKIVECLAQK